MQHCWHDSGAKYPPSRSSIDAAAGRGRVCCYCAEYRSEPLPPPPPRRIHGPYVEDNTDWFVLGEAGCPGMQLVKLNHETVVVDMHEP
jgi:hypothetical protein